MTSSHQDWGLQSFCLRHYKETTAVIERLQACGVRAVELCRLHADFSDPARFEGTFAAYRDAGIGIVSLGVEKIIDEKPARLLCECAHRAGIRHLSVTFLPETSPASWRLAEKLAEEYDLKFGIHNHGGAHWLGSRQMLGHVLKQTGSRIGLCLDTAWAMAAGEDPLKLIEEFGERIYGIHLKDFVFDRAGKPTDTVVGSGNLDLPRFIPVLKTLPNLLFSVVEYEGDVEDPVASLKACLEAIRSA